MEQSFDKEFQENLKAFNESIENQKKQFEQEKESIKKAKNVSYSTSCGDDGSCWYDEVSIHLDNNDQPLVYRFYSEGELDKFLNEVNLNDEE